jgi:hypothetical protein
MDSSSLRWCGSAPELDEAGKAHMIEKAARSGGPKMEAHGTMSDEWVADRVRMLSQNDIDHEAICCAARDRIMRLTLQVRSLESRLASGPLMDINGYQIKRLLDFVDNENEAELTLRYVDHERPDGNSNDGEMMPKGLYAWYTDYPDEGSMWLPETPEEHAASVEPRSSSNDTEVKG